MSVTQRIVATYRGPGRVVRTMLRDGPREDRALAMVMAGCFLLFVSRWPATARQSHLDQVDLGPLLGALLLGLIFILPLILYLVAGLSHLLAALVGGQGSFFGARLALFWAFLAVSPVTLLNGLVEGFIGPGPAQNVTGLVLLGLFLWFWLRGLWVVERGVAA